MILITSYLIFQHALYQNAKADDSFLLKASDWHTLAKLFLRYYSQISTKLTTKLSTKLSLSLSVIIDLGNADDSHELFTFLDSLPLKRLLLTDPLSNNILQRIETFRFYSGIQEFYVKLADRLLPASINPSQLGGLKYLADHIGQLRQWLISSKNLQVLDRETIALEPYQKFSKHLQDPLVIDLYASSDWKERLIGQLQYAGQMKSPFEFQPGAIQQAIRQRKNFLEIHHASTDNLDWQRFFADLNRDRCIEANGERIFLLDSFTWTLSNPNYRFDRELSVTVESMQTTGMITADYVLSPYTVETLFKQTHYCNEQHIFSERPGLLANYANQTLSLYVTHTLSESVWARVYQAAADQHSQLGLVLGDNVILPAGLKTQTRAKNLAQIKKSIPANSHFIVTGYISQDIPLTVQKLKAHNNNVRVISIDSQTSYTDLVSPMTIHASGNPVSLFPSFHRWDGELLSALKAGQSIILKGNFSPELACQLSSLFTTHPFLLTNGTPYPVTKGQVSLVTEQKDVFAYMAKTEFYRESLFTMSDRFEQLAQEGVPNTVLEKLKKHLPAEQLEKFSYTQLQTIVKGLKTAPGKNPLKSLSLFLDNTEDLNRLGKKLKQQENVIKYPIRRHDLPFEPFQEQTRRLEKLKKHLDTSPYTFIMGSSGIGKSTLVLEKLQPYYESKGQTLKLSVGMEQLVTWASNTTANTTQLLFLDEANLSKEGSFDCFEGLFDEQPSIFTRGK